jgi:hypothetical protein
MKLLLDECLPRKLKDGLPGHDCHTLPEEGLGGKKERRTPVVSRNSRLSDFSDTRLRPCISTELAGRAIAIVLLRAQSRRVADLLPKIPEISKALSSAQPGQVIKVG